MKERIYTIALTDAINKKCGCTLCTLEKKFEEDAVSYFLGPSLMEPDGRMLTNDKGFCRRHMSMMLDFGNRLGMALTLETHLAEVSKRLVPKKKNGMLAHGIDAPSSSEQLTQMANSCALCEKLDGQMSAAAQNMVFLIETEKEFRDAFIKGDGLCLLHASLLVRESERELHGKAVDDFIAFIYQQQKEKIDALQKRVHNFTLSFDYRNSQKPDEETTKSVEEAAKKLTKF